MQLSFPFYHPSLHACRTRVQHTRYARLMRGTLVFTDVVNVQKYSK